MRTLWHTIVFRPLFNFLLYLYHYQTNFNLGWAVVYLTVLLRIALLPFSVITERGKEFYRRIGAKIKEAQHDYADDPVKMRGEVRRLLRQHKIRPWSRTVVLAFHVVVLIALYQVFVGGLRAGQFPSSYFYRAVPQPEFINTKFFCFPWLQGGSACLDIARPNAPFAAVVAFVLFIEITLAQRGQKGRLTQQELVYRLLFPAFTFVALALLPSVKSVFILTSLLISLIISLCGALFWGASHRQTEKSQAQAAQRKAAPDPFTNELYGRHPR